MLSVEEMKEKIKDYCYKHDCDCCPLDPNGNCYINATDKEVIANYCILNNAEAFTNEDDTQTNEVDEIKNSIHLNGYIFDSLTYRYQLARERQLMYEIVKEGVEPKIARDRFNRDMMRFGQILDEAMGEHD